MEWTENNVENAWGNTIEVILAALRKDIAQNYSDFMKKQSLKTQEVKQMIDVDSEFDSQFTDLDKVISLCFKFEYTKSKGKETISKIKNSLYVIDYNEDSMKFAQNFTNSVKAPIAEKIKEEMKTKHSVEEIIDRSKLNILNAPEIILLKSTKPPKFEKRFTYVPFRFSIKDLWSDEVLSPVAEDEYEIWNIVSYNREDSKFEILTKNLNGKWSGFADGVELTPDHFEFTSLLFSIDENNVACNSWWVVSWPVMMVFKKILPKEIEFKTAKYSEKDVEEIFFDNEEDK